MPKRSNLFQDTVAVVQQHLAGEAEVEESAYLKERTTGEEREVDVVVRSMVAGQEVIVSIEATSTHRKADLTWVDTLLGKHADLPTSKLVLVSEAGFTKPARLKAEAKGAVPMAPQDLAGDHPSRRMIEQLAELAQKELTAEITDMAMYARRPNGDPVLVRVPLNMNVYNEDGQYLTMLINLFHSERDANAAEFARVESELPVGEGHEMSATMLTHALDPFWNLPGGVKIPKIYARWTQVDPPELQVIEKVEVLAKVDVRAAPPIAMSAARQLGDVAYAFGETMFDGEQALVVLTASEKLAQLTVRLRPNRK